MDKRVSKEPLKVDPRYNIGKVVRLVSTDGALSVKIKFNQKVKISDEWKILLGLKNR